MAYVTAGLCSDSDADDTDSDAQAPKRPIMLPVGAAALSTLAAADIPLLDAAGILVLRG